MYARVRTCHSAWGLGTGFGLWAHAMICGALAQHRAMRAMQANLVKGAAGLGSGGSRAAGLGFSEGGSAGAASAPIAVGNGVGGFVAGAPAAAAAAGGPGAGQDEAAFHMYRRLRSGAYKETLARTQQAAVEGLGR